MAMKESGKEVDAFNFDPKDIDWEDYIVNIHIPGLLRYVLKRQGRDRTIYAVIFMFYNILCLSPF